MKKFFGKRKKDVEEEGGSEAEDFIRKTKKNKGKEKEKEEKEVEGEVIEEVMEKDDKMIAQNLNDFSKDFEDFVKENDKIIRYGSIVMKRLNKLREEDYEDVDSDGLARLLGFERLKSYESLRIYLRLIADLGLIDIQEGVHLSKSVTIKELKLHLEKLLMIVESVFTANVYNAIAGILRTLADVGFRYEKSGTLVDNRLVYHLAPDKKDVDVIDTFYFSWIIHREVQSFKALSVVGYEDLKVDLMFGSSNIRTSKSNREIMKSKIKDLSKLQELSKTVSFEEILLTEVFRDLDG